MSLFSIRPATKDDCKDIVRLMKEMAENERMPNGFKVDEKTLQKDGFGKRPFYYCFVAELNKEELSAGIVGYVLYFFTYSTWEGRSIYVQDLYVSPQYRRRGMGSALQKRTVQDKLSIDNFIDRRLTVQNAFQRD